MLEILLLREGAMLHRKVASLSMAGHVSDSHLAKLPSSRSQCADPESHLDGSIYGTGCYNMVCGLFLCTTLTGRRGSHAPFMH